MTGTIVRDQARRIVEQMPDDATWEDLIYQLTVIQSIEDGLADVQAGRCIPHGEVKKRFGIES